MPAQGAVKLLTPDYLHRSAGCLETPVWRFVLLSLTVILGDCVAVPVQCSTLGAASCGSASGCERVSSPYVALGREELKPKSYSAQQNPHTGHKLYLGSQHLQAMQHRPGQSQAGRSPRNSSQGPEKIYAGDNDEKGDKCIRAALTLASCPAPHARQTSILASTSGIIRQQCRSLQPVFLTPISCPKRHHCFSQGPGALYNGTMG
ncbi:hypothetical protein NDU88_002773 [Pleurodeles waltl]|uniref:Uncharacterized protein n=1 Tax=Pleurodeles waltl TaxID=8319 RepID=A0AAV7PAB4_PLEWA|nr:hypothetical protein NDU88_002773 [Pleurodeles waltl]